MTSTEPKPAGSRVTDEPPPGGGAVQRASRFRRSLPIAFLTALLALVAGAIGLAFDLKPEWRPDPRTAQAASLETLTVDPEVTWDEWLNRRGGTTQELDPCQLRVPGNLVYLGVELQGFKRRSVRYRFSTYDDRTRARLEGVLRSVSSGNRPVSTLVGEAPTDRWISTVWVAWPFRDGDFFVRFELFEERSGGEETILGFADTPKFTADKQRYRMHLEGCSNEE
jgi:hypothetical protein